MKDRDASEGLSSELSSEPSSELSDELLEHIAGARQLAKWPIAKLISQVEIDTEQGIANRQAIMRYLSASADSKQKNKNAMVVGITGTPGAGKSSLINELSKVLLQNDESFSIAVVAIDPSSQKTGGALLGDRTRIDFANGGERLFVRSQASDLDLGGLGRKTYHVVRLLKHFFDLVIVETVGIGQSEIEVDRLSDLSLLVMQPLAGDQVQFIKAGIMEVPDAFVVNKCDEESLANSSYNLLCSSLKITDKHDAVGNLIEKPVFMTSTQNLRGIEELAGFIAKKTEDFSAGKLGDGSGKSAERYFIQKWIKEYYGRYGLEIYNKELLSGGSLNNALSSSLNNSLSYEDVESQFSELMAEKIGR